MPGPARLAIMHIPNNIDSALLLVTLKDSVVCYCHLRMVALGVAFWNFRSSHIDKSGPLPRDYCRERLPDRTASRELTRPAMSSCTG